MPLYRLTPTKLQTYTWNGLTLKLGVGNAVMVNTTAAIISSALADKEITVKEYKDTPPSNFVIHTI